MIAKFTRSPESNACSFLFTLALLSCFAVGCGNNGAAVGTATTAQQQQSPKEIQDAFKGAKPEIKAEADQIAAAIQNQETPQAFLRLQQLSTRTDLTSEQSVASARVMAAVRGQLAAAAARGDKAAAEILEMYRSTK